MPEWLLNKQLEQTHMRESVEESKGSIRSALETWIVDRCKNLDPTSGRDEKKWLDTYRDSTDRLSKLVEKNLVTYVKRDSNDDILFYKRLILDLRENYGITRDQLPTLKALADFIPGSIYIQHDGYYIIKCSITVLQEYFGESTK